MMQPDKQFCTDDLIKQ